MNWFEQEFKGQIVYLLRHPIPTSLSRKRYSILPLYLKNDTYCKRYLNDSILKYCAALIESRSEFQKKILDWCLQNLAPLKYLDKSNWLILYYEDMVMNPGVTLDTLIQRLQLTGKNQRLKQYNRASVSTTQSDLDTQKFLAKDEPLNDRTYLISKWRSKITEEEEAQAFDILNKFGINIYQFGYDMPVRRI